MNMRHLGDAVEGFFLFKERVKRGRDFPSILLLCPSKAESFTAFYTGGVYLDSPAANPLL